MIFEKVLQHVWSLGLDSEENHLEGIRQVHDICHKVNAGQDRNANSIVK